MAKRDATPPTPTADNADDMAQDGADFAPGLDERDHRLLAALLAARSTQEAATAAHVSARTVFRRLADPTFATALRNARRAVLAQAGTALVAATEKACGALLDVLDEAEAPAAARVAAARVILESARGFMELDDLAERIAALEEAAKQ
jgi:hypothetical protein